jgi:ribonucleoside-diphosphate reductase alpha chain
MSLVLRIPSPVDRQKRLAWIADELVDIGGGRPMGFGSSRVRSLPDGVAQVLLRHLDQSPASEPQNGQPASDPTPFAIGDICPDCGEAALLYEEGCRKCHFCGYSEC